MQVMGQFKVVSYVVYGNELVLVMFVSTRVRMDRVRVEFFQPVRIPS